MSCRSAVTPMSRSAVQPLFTIKSPRISNPFGWMAASHHSVPAEATLADGAAMPVDVSKYTLDVREVPCRSVRYMGTLPPSVPSPPVAVLESLTGTTTLALFTRNRDDSTYLCIPCSASPSHSFSGTCRNWCRLGKRRHTAQLVCLRLCALHRLRTFSS